MPVFLPGESHGQRSLADYSPWGHKESDTAERRTRIGLGSVIEPTSEDHCEEHMRLLSPQEILMLFT